MLKRHERLSDLHRQNLEKQDELVQQRKDEIRHATHVMRRQIQELENVMNEQVLRGESQQQQRLLLEMQIKQLIFEYGQAQEMLEDSRGLRHRLAQKPGCGIRKASAKEPRVGRLVFSSGAASWQGNKDVQEDRFILDIELKSPEGHLVLGFLVLDGHSGSLCVDQLIDRFPTTLQRCLSAKPSLTEENLSKAVTEACLLADEDFLQLARQHQVLDGSTFLLGLIFPDESKRRAPGTCRLLVANVGDSRAVLCRSGFAAGSDGAEVRYEAVRLSEDHKPIVPEEQRRIQAHGGYVDLQGVWRVFMPGPATFGGRLISRWGLAVSRAFGDLLLKEPERYGCAGVMPGGLITAVPEIRVVDINPTEDRFLVLACDGIWDVLGDDDAVAVCSSQASAEHAALALIRRSFTAGSDDNLTAIVVTWRTVD